MHTREAVAQVLDRSRLLLFADLLIFLLVGSSLEALPWKTTTEEVHEYVTQSFQVVSARLLASQMGVDTHVTSCTGERLALPVRNVLLRLWVTVLLSHTEIHNVNYVSAFGARSANEKVVRLDVAIDEVLLVNSLNSRQLHAR